MQVKITKTTVADNQFVLAGRVYDLSDSDAKLLIQLGKAVRVEAAQPAPSQLDTEQAEAVVGTEMPKRKGRGRGAK